jgi:isoleucyl-tRNA synthetase
MAPWAPFLSDHIYKELHKDESDNSVHLASWPEAGKYDQAILEQMAAAREVINEDLAQRAEAGVKVRQPLQSIDVQVTTELPQEMAQIIAEEVNVKEIPDLKQADHHSVKLDVTITPELQREGMSRDIVRRIQNLRKQSGLEVDNHISLSVTSDDAEVVKAVEEHADFISAETLAKSLNTDDSQEYEEVVKIGGVEITIKLQKV